MIEYLAAYCPPIGLLFVTIRLLFLWRKKRKEHYANRTNRNRTG